MSDIDQASASVPIPEPPPIDPAIVFPTINANDPQAQAQINAMVAQMQAQMEQQRTAMLEEATNRFRREMAEVEERNRITAYAQHVTTPTFQRPHALPFTEQEVGTFLMGLPSASRGQARTMFDKLLTSGFVDFSEYGSSADGEPSLSAAERWNAEVGKKTGKGMARSAAIKELMREQPDLYAEYSSSGNSRRTGGRN